MPTQQMDQPSEHCSETEPDDRFIEVALSYREKFNVVLGWLDQIHRSNVDGVWLLVPEYKYRKNIQY